MMCSHCELSIRKEVMKLPGVREMSADLKAKTVTVTHDGSVGTDALKQAIREAGYKVQ